MIKIKDKIVSKDELNKYIRNRWWMGLPVSDIFVMYEELDFQTHPYIILLYYQTNNVIYVGFNRRWEIKIFLINLIFKIRDCFKFN